MGCSVCILRPLSPHPVRLARARTLHPHSAPRTPHSAPLPCAPLVRLGGRARCSHRAAAPSARCAAWHPVRRCYYAAWQVAHAESFACRGSVRDTVRGRAAHPARCHDRAAIYPRALSGRRGARLAPRSTPPHPRAPAPRAPPVTARHPRPHFFFVVRRDFSR